jgi:hypothetical protein
MSLTKHVKEFIMQTIIRNVSVNYAKVYKAEENPFGAKQFDIQLEFAKDRIDELKGYGKIRELPNGNFAMNIARSATNKDGKENFIRVVDMAKEPFTAPIGNGSTANLIVYTYASPRAYNGTKTVLMAVQIVNHIPYEPTTSVDFDLVESNKPTPDNNVDF